MARISLVLLLFAGVLPLALTAQKAPNPGAARDFSHSTHMTALIRLILGWGEIAGCILLLIPKTAMRGAWFLFAVFIFAILIHLLHGQYNVGNVVVYAAAALAIALGRA